MHTHIWPRYFTPFFSIFKGDPLKQKVCPTINISFWLIIRKIPPKIQPTAPSFLRFHHFRGSILSSASRLFIFAGLTRICILGHQTKCTPTNATANWNENGICVHFKSNGIFCFTQTRFELRHWRHILRPFVDKLKTWYQL